MDVAFVLIVLACVVFAALVLTMISLLCLRFMNGMLEWGEKKQDEPLLFKEAYQRIDVCTESVNKKEKLPEAAMSVHTVQPHGKVNRDEESDIPYSEDSDDNIEYCRPIQRIINPKENLGKLYYSMQYIPNSKLLVKLVKADELPEAKSELPTVYVTAGILACSNNNNQELKSKIHKGSCCPVFNDVLEFDVSDINVDEKYLRFVVWYVDNFSQGECLGSVEQNLSQMKDSYETDTQPLDMETVICKDIHRITQDFQECNEHNLQGALLCSVTYIPTSNKLTIVLFKVQNINLYSDDNQGVYAEVTIVHMKRNKRKRKVTSSVPGTSNIVYNEAILFDLGDLDIDSIKLQITMKQKRLDKADKAISRVLMGSDVCDSKARLHWSDAINANKPVAQWHRLHRCIAFNTTGRRKLRSRLSDSGNETGFQQMLSDSSTSDEN